MVRRCFTLFWVASLLLWCAAAALLWRGISHNQHVTYSTANSCFYDFYSDDTGIALGRCNFPDGPGGLFFEELPGKRLIRNSGRSVAGFSYQHSLVNSPVEVWSIEIPEWFVIGAPAVLPVLWIARRVRTNIRAARAARGHCAHCNYDLCATPDRCPECGAIPDSPLRQHPLLQ